jgi:hypothetical protein
MGEVGALEANVLTFAFRAGLGPGVAGFPVSGDGKDDDMEDRLGRQGALGEENSEMLDDVIRLADLVTGRRRAADSASRRFQRARYKTGDEPGLEGVDGLQEDNVLL